MVQVQTARPADHFPARSAIPLISRSIISVTALEVLAVPDTSSPPAT
jgi:hypothetical protein